MTANGDVRSASDRIATLLSRDPTYEQILDSPTETITDDIMRERLARTKPYCAVILHPTERVSEPGARTRHFGGSNAHSRHATSCVSRFNSTRNSSGPRRQGTRAPLLTTHAGASSCDASGWRLAPTRGCRYDHIL